MNQQPAQRIVKRSRASLIVLITLAFLLMVAAVVLIFMLPDDDSWWPATDASQPASVESVGFDCEPAEAQQLFPFANGLIKVTGSRITRLDSQGQELSALDIDFAAPFTVRTDHWFLVADREGYGFLMLDAQGEQFRGSTEGRISGASIGPQGHLALVQDQLNSTGVVSLYTPGNGSKLYDIHFPESGYVLSVAFSHQDDVFDVSLLNTDASSARPIIKRYHLDGQAIGQRLPDAPALYPLMVHQGADQLVLCGAHELIALTFDSQAIAWQRSFYQVQTVIPGPFGLIAVAAEELDGAYHLYQIDQSGQDAFSIFLGEGATEIRQYQHLAAVASGNRLLVVDLRSGQIILDQQMPSEVVRLGFIDDQMLTIVLRTGVRRIELR